MDIEELYLHIPFCTSRCAYCDFSTRAVQSDSPLMDAYVDALGVLVRRASKAGLLGGLDSLYLGGGTPTYLGSSRLTRLLYLISLSTELGPDTEFSMEANPESLDSRLLRDIRALSVTRISLGVQSLDDQVLRTLGRAHGAKRALECIDLLVSAGMNVSVDLICGVPGQTETSWQDTLNRCVSLGISHMSVYPLSVEPGTPLAAKVDSGMLSAPDEDVQASMMLAASDTLEDAGLKRYEVASYARPGFACRHNIGYWSSATYLGLGVAASSYVPAQLVPALVDARIIAPVASLSHDTRMVRLNCIDTIEGFCESGIMHVEVEELDSTATACEQLMLRMRMPAGVTEDEVALAGGLVDGVDAVFDGLQRDGLVRQLGRSLVPTQRGWLMGNVLFGRIWGLAGN